MSPSAQSSSYFLPGSDDLAFRGSSKPTLGVELEMQVIDPFTGDLVPGAPRILDACREEALHNVDGEFLQSMLEVRTGVCRDVTEVRNELVPLLRRVRNLAKSLGYDLGMAATHPFHRATASAVSPQERYQRIRRRQAWLVQQEAIFGLHIHVGVPDGERAMGLINLLVPYLPHLLALSANSPFWQGVDTGFASARATLFKPAAHAGIPQHCPNWDSFIRYYQVLRDGGVVAATKDLYWDIRPRHDFGTLEFRIFDVPAGLPEVLGLVALTRALVVNGLRILEEAPALGAGDPGAFWLAAENRSLASRYGLSAQCVRQPGLEPRTLAEDLHEVIERVMPVAAAHGDADFLQIYRPLRYFRAGADEQRRLLRETGDWNAVVNSIRGRWAAALNEAEEDVEVLTGV